MIAETEEDASSFVTVTPSARWIVRVNPSRSCTVTVLPLTVSTVPPMCGSCFPCSGPPTGPPPSVVDGVCEVPGVGVESANAAAPTPTAPTTAAPATQLTSTARRVVLVNDFMGGAPSVCAAARGCIQITGRC